MKAIHVHGGVRLFGKVRIQGSKNAALPILAATLLTEDSNLIRNCPGIADVCQMLRLLRAAGCLVCRQNSGIRITARCVHFCCFPEEAVQKMRSSMYLMGVLLSETGEVNMELPGGCAIGARPIDLHLEALTKMGAEFCVDKGRIIGKAPKGLHGALIHLRFPSVGATENILLAAAKAQGTTEIFGAAREPEVSGLCCYLKQCGADIEGVGTEHLVIRGVRRLHGTEYMIPADRIVAGTYLFACLGTRGRVLLEEAPVEQLGAVIDFAEQLGAECENTPDGLYVQAPAVLKSPERLITMPYPGFPTDLQSAALALLTVSEGTCIIEETVFENRFRIAEPLAQMGACLEQVSAGAMRVHGPCCMKGRVVTAEELRGGAALVTAGLVARGETVIRNCHYIDRGYENICRDFKELGARIYCE